VRVFAKAQRLQSMGKEFPKNLHQQPILLPARNNALRPKLEHWFETHGILPTVVGEFEDLALLEAFGRGGMGVFVMPCQSVEDVVRGENDVQYLGDAQGVFEEFYAFAHPRSLDHPALRLLFNGAVQNTEQLE
jgi:LysR family transcriptional regulator, transcriptional activator of nhaA